MSQVFFIDLRASSSRTNLDRIDRLLDRAGFRDIDWNNRLTALKMHFGELGNTTFVQPVYVRHLVKRLKELGAKTALMDTNTLYRGSRENAVSHIFNALANGFSYATIEAPVIIADGLKGTSCTKVPIEGIELKEVSLGKELVDADALFVLSHFKLHELTGFGGAIKNIGMGGADRAGKLIQHSTVGPNISQDKCIACGACVVQCNFDAIRLPEGAKAEIDPDKCTGCGSCIVVCPEEAIRITWDAGAMGCQKRMAEHALGLLKNKQGRYMFVNFITGVSPACDCYGHADAPIVADIGIAASKDPVALDRACMDLVNAAAGLPGTALKTAHAPGTDKARDVYPDIDWTVQLDHGECIGLGNKDYELIKL